MAQINLEKSINLENEDLRIKRNSKKYLTPRKSK